MSEASGSLTLDYTRLARSKTNREPVRRLINILQCRGENPFLGRLNLRFSAFCWVEELLLGEDKLEHGTDFFNHSKNSCKEGRI